MRILFMLLALVVVQPTILFAAVDRNQTGDEECIKRAYEIGYNITETSKNQTNAFLELEGDCIYSYGDNN
jgi:hypothetical protein